jgi:hypothetical protein
LHRQQPLQQPLGVDALGSGQRRVARQTEPTKTASIGDPNTALAAEPTASTGVTGSESSSRMASTKSATARLTAVPADPTVFVAAAAVLANRDRGSEIGRGGGGGSTPRTCPTDMACHSWTSERGGAGSRSTRPRPHRR